MLRNERNPSLGSVGDDYKCVQINRARSDRGENVRRQTALLSIDRRRDSRQVADVVAPAGLYPPLCK